MELILLCLFAFLAGFTDAIAGGGGLIQTPAALVLLPQYPLATVLGTLKIPSFSGTSIATAQYVRRVPVNWLLIAVMTVIAFCAAFAGSTLLAHVNSSFMKPLLLIMLIIVAIYTFTNRRFGDHTEKGHSAKQQVIYSMLISLVIGFYDGFIGPGAGSFLILSFIGLMGFDFLKASAHAKFVNLATNLGSITFFSLTGKIIYAVALPMAVCNALGGWLGARLAILKGNAFIRIFFLIVVCATIIRFAYDVFFRR
ncbi:TSUP family transporter [Longitalea arenae]|uniref:TSUP family transporter n=1 Tax=Longitalea arenae TaxID=2812558 RepID=UPI0019681219|nr:TSUP family transporter [Longitalea arenae]